MTTIEKTKRCPFCNAKSTIHGPTFTEAYRCGTRREVGDSGYHTGDECDKVCYRNGLLEATGRVKELQAENQRLREALQGIVKHQEYTGGSMSAMSLTRAIALKALEERQ